MTATELRELDAWIAEHVMGCRFRESEGSIRFAQVELPTDKGAKWCGLNLIPNYSTDPAAAMEVLKKCAEKVGPVRINKRRRGDWIASKHEDMEPVWAVAETIELAICLFAKKLFA